jgi:hypothetical protein
VKVALGAMMSPVVPCSDLTQTSLALAWVVERAPQASDRTKERPDATSQHRRQTRFSCTRST